MKKYLWLLAAMLMLGAVTTSCRGDDEESGSTSVRTPTTKEEAMEILTGQWRVSQALFDYMMSHEIWDESQADEVRMEINADGSCNFLFRIAKGAVGAFGAYEGKYISFDNVDGSKAVPDAKTPTEGVFPVFLASGAAPFRYRNLTSASVEVYLYYWDEDEEEDFFGGLGWQTFTKVESVEPAVHESLN